jgi:hypothetical protein
MSMDTPRMPGIWSLIMPKKAAYLRNTSEVNKLQCMTMSHKMYYVNLGGNGGGNPPKTVVKVEGGGGADRSPGATTDIVSSPTTHGAN